MEEQLITFETAKLAKEKGFDKKVGKYWCNYYTGEPLNKWKLLPIDKLTLNWMEYPAPTQSLLQKWLREEHNIVVLVFLHNTRYGCTIKNLKEKEQVRFVSENCLIYEKTLEEGLLEGLKFIINNEQN